MTFDLIRRQDAIDALMEIMDRPNHAEFLYTDEICNTLNDLPSAQPDPTLHCYPIEHLEMIARVMSKEHCTPEDVMQLLQNAGEIAKMVRDEMMEMIKESIERSCKGVAND